MNAAAPRHIKPPYPVQGGRPSALARGILRAFGWHIRHSGLPAPQGVILVYPHTSNWDYPIGVLTKWALGLPLRYWAKDSLFRVPLLGAFARAVGGIPVDRSARHGMVGAAAAQLRQARARGELFWLAVAPEGTRSLTSGWRTGGYRVAVEAQAPIALAYFDYAEKVVGFDCFIQPSGDIEQDFACFAAYLGHRQGKRPAHASPIRPRP